MQIVESPLTQLREAPWNPNVMDALMLQKLKNSILRYGLVGILVVRPLVDDSYQVLSGNQRLQVLRELGWQSAPCLVVNLADAEAKLLAQALNHLQGSDELGLRAELLKELIHTLPQQEVLSLLPETAQSLSALSSLGQDDMADYLKNWQQAQGSRLKHLTIQLSVGQVETVEAAFSRVMAQVKELQSDNPNPRGNALYFLCKIFLEQEGKSL
jgi:ParB family transcriptional regulator, chromosome partitioning protein